MALSDARQHFYQAISPPEAEVDLARAALYIAQEEYPDLNVEGYIDQLQQMAAAVQARLPQEHYPLRIIQTINQYLYEQLGFTGNTSDYYDPRNSFLNDVLDRRMGIPITLSLVYLEIAQRINFPMVGVGMPGHFLICPDVEEMEIYVDPFYQGHILFAEDCQDRLTEIYGRPVEADKLALFLEKVGPRRILVRMLTNLKIIYLNQGELQKSLNAVERILLLLPNSLSELRDRGVLHYHLGHWPAACEDLENYLVQAPGAEDGMAIQQLLNRMRRAT